MIFVCLGEFCRSCWVGRENLSYEECVLVARMMEVPVALTLGLLSSFPRPYNVEFCYKMAQMNLT